MTDRLESSWKLDGFVDEQRYYCSETPIDPDNLPAAKAILTGDVRNYVDTLVTTGSTYYVRISALKNGIEKLSEERVVVIGIEYNSLFFNANDVMTYGTNVLISANSEVGGLTIGSLSPNKSNVFRLLGSPIFQNFTATFDFTRLQGYGSNAAVGFLFATTNWGSADLGNLGYMFAIAESRAVLIKGTNQSSGNETTLRDIPYVFPSQEKMKVRIVATTSTLQIWVDGVRFVNLSDLSIAPGQIGFRSWSDASGVSSMIENLQVIEN